MTIGLEDRRERGFPLCSNHLQLLNIINLLPEEATMDMEEAVDAAGDAVEDMNSEALQLALDDSQAEIIKLREENKALKADKYRIGLEGVSLMSKAARLEAETKRLREALEGIVARVELANREGDPIASAWLPQARYALGEAGKVSDGMVCPVHGGTRWTGGYCNLWAEQTGKGPCIEENQCGS